MLVRLAIQPNALQLNGYHLPQSAEVVQRVKDVLLQTGVVVNFQGTGGVQTEITSMSCSLGTMWRAIFVEISRRRRIAGESMDLTNIESLDALVQVIRGRVAVLLVDPASSTILPLSPENGCLARNDLNLEICRIDCTGLSKVLRGAVDRLKDTIPEGSTPNEVWNRYIEPWAQFQTHLYVVDRYAGKTCRVLDPHFNSGFRIKSGLESFLTRLNTRFQADKYVTVFTSIVDYGENLLVESIDDLIGRLRPGALREVNVFLTPDDDFPKIAHHRHLRFADDVVLILDRGISALQEPCVKPQMPYFYTDRLREYLDTESRLRAKKRRKLSYICPRGGSRFTAVPS